MPYPMNINSSLNAVWRSEIAIIHAFCVKLNKNKIRTKCESLQKFLLRLAFAKSRVSSNLTDSNPLDLLFSH